MSDTEQKTTVSPEVAKKNSKKLLKLCSKKTTADRNEVIALLEAGADPDYTYDPSSRKYDSTPLLVSLANKNAVIPEILLAYGCKPTGHYRPRFSEYSYSAEKLSKWEPYNSHIYNAVWNKAAQLKEGMLNIDDRRIIGSEADLQAILVAKAKIEYATSKYKHIIYESNLPEEVKLEINHALDYIDRVKNRLRITSRSSGTTLSDIPVSRNILNENGKLEEQFFTRKSLTEIPGPPPKTPDTKEEPHSQEPLATVDAQEEPAQPNPPQSSAPPAETSEHDPQKNEYIRNGFHLYGHAADIEDINDTQKEILSITQPFNYAATLPKDEHNKVMEKIQSAARTLQRMTLMRENDEETNLDFPFVRRVFNVEKKDFDSIVLLPEREHILLLDDYLAQKKSPPITRVPNIRKQVLKPGE
ncbi:MAG: hypothetical protein OXT65_04895 [Alphaproteobacteria bacterium]|nr:hypothetical protein [Alphaproteobacteria bacterium]